MGTRDVRALIHPSRPCHDHQHDHRQQKHISIQKEKGGYEGYATACGVSMASGEPDEADFGVEGLEVVVYPERYMCR